MISRRAFLGSVPLALAATQLPSVAVAAPAPRAAAAALAYDWSSSNLPWKYSSTSVFTSKWPTGVKVVNLQTASTDFYTNLRNTVNAAGGRVVVRLGTGVYRLKSFRKIGSSGSETYAFGFWFPKLQGLLGQGPDKTFVQMDANSYTTAQLNSLKTMKLSSFAPLQAGFCRLDGSAASPVLLAGLTVRGADQQPLTAVASDVKVVTPQPAPYNGVTLYAGASSFVSYVRFQAAAHAMTSQPPFEMANLSSQYGSHRLDHVEFDGRLSASINAARPRRCGPLMAGNETLYDIRDSWIHHSNVSRYAVNDQNRNTSGTYSATRVKAEQITNTKNGGLGGYTNATPFGWESCSGTINMTDCIIHQDNPYTDRQTAQHLQLTSVGSRNPRGGRMNVVRGTYRNSDFPSIDGYLCMRIIPTTFWAKDGYATTIRAVGANGVRKTAHVVTGTWPPTAAALKAARVTKETHYLVRNS